MCEENYFNIMKNSAKLFVFIFLTFPVLTSCVFTNQGVIRGNHQLVNQRIDIDNYEKIILNLPAEVLYQQFSDSAPYLQIHTDKNILQVLDIKVQNDQLIISVKQDSIIKPSKLTVYTSSHNLSSVSVAGSGEVRLKGEVNSLDITLSITGSGKLTADSLLCNKITAIITGSGNVHLIGASNYSFFNIRGSGSINAFDYLVQELNCNITGSGEIEAVVSNKLDVNISGSGSLLYRGKPETVTKKIIGSGNIKAVN